MATVRHRFSCPLRWADLDLLGHVNNVRYADYLRAARDDLVRASGIDAETAALPVRRHELTFLAPLMFSREPVVVESWFSERSEQGAVLEHEILGGGPDPRVHLRARSFLGDAAWTSAPVVVRSAPDRHYSLQVRAGDLDMTGAASDVAFVEFFQEARIGFFDRIMHEGLERGKVRWVVAQTDIDYLRPVECRPTAYDCFSRLARVGTKSLTVESVIRDEVGADHATARVVLVVFDPVANRSVVPPAGYRELLETFISVD